MVKKTGEPAGIGMLSKLIDQRVHQVLTCAPDNMIAGQGVAIAKLTSFYPVGNGKEPDALGLEPVVDVINAAVDIKFCPFHRPVIVLREPCKRVPVPQSGFRAVVNSIQALYGRVDQGHAAKGICRETTEILF